MSVQTVSSTNGKDYYNSNVTIKMQDYYDLIMHASVKPTLELISAELKNDLDDMKKKYIQLLRDFNDLKEYTKQLEIAVNNSK